MERVSDILKESNEKCTQILSKVAMLRGNARDHAVELCEIENLLSEICSALTEAQKAMQVEYGTVLRNDGDNDIVVHYIECACHCMDHLARIMHEPDYGEFYIELQLGRFPGESQSVTFKPDQPVKNFFRMQKLRVRRVRRYFLNVWWAICGRPLWYTADISMSYHQALKLSEFLYKEMGTRGNFSLVEAKNILNKLHEASKFPEAKE